MPKSKHRKKYKQKVKVRNRLKFEEKQNKKKALQNFITGMRLQQTGLMPKDEEE